MVKICKRMKEADKLVDKEKAYPLREAITNVSKFPKTKFDETVELHFHLNIDIKNSDQSVRGTVILPSGTGKKVRIAVFCKGPQADKARDLGADFVGAEDLIEKVEKGFLDFDCAIATPDMMRDLSKLGKVLGPRGLMPSPKAGTVSMDVERAIKEVKAGKIEFKSDKQAGIHVGIGKRSFSEDQLFENATHVIEAINHAKPASVKGNLLKSISLSTTMGPGMRLAL
ncbi:MAG TPA: 50S ribosomal protein L1 [Candidatus Omnitrophota bacterium]|nr:50S ribosomal protein L1 [Candidatus Omnitrophota bacterium]HPD83976.1 50S ribosomal protein L1 [Candidatus Omnitrophota bacterium]HRZ02833.1 50S ribosomal protein L1 [Candidatus Omnitrophota bacterium]